ncbi:MAG: hypothetical protein XE11_0462 [Methanomicrobiales archaeon 53_19]|jgi:hypothetical protein|nr:MAG: hypothetical protein XD88_1064 [Methanocalculus sp. 52_23]KUL04682.1 MAG: hypothetical protein XE11_0462 [Methanomicrobiales archaeon 53_19]
MGFERRLLHPSDRLVRADHLTYSTEASLVQMLETAVCTPPGSIQLRYKDTPLIRPLPLLEYVIWADHHAEVAPFTPYIIDNQFHAMETLAYRIVRLFNKHLRINTFIIAPDP